MATGDHDWTANEVVSAANMDDYLQLQVVQQFASAAARDTALSARKREGMVTYQLDTNTLTVYSGATWSTIGPVHGAMLTWTPAVVQSVSVTSTVGKATYNRVGRMVTAFYVVNVTGAGTAANVVTVTLPVAADAGWVSDNASLGFGMIIDASAVLKYEGVAAIASTTTMKFRSHATTALAFLGTVNFTAGLAAGDVVCASITYEAGADA